MVKEPMLWEVEGKEVGNYDRTGDCPGPTASKGFQLESQLPRLKPEGSHHHPNWKLVEVSSKLCGLVGCFLNILKGGLEDWPAAIMLAPP